MKKIYSLVLMAVILLVGTNAWAKTIKVAQTAEEGIDYTSLVTAFANAETGDVIQLQSDMTLSSYIWIGEADQAATSGTGKVLTLDLNGKLLSYSGSAPFIQLTHGKLTIKTSLTGGKIYSNKTGTAAESVILVTGSTLKDCEPKTQTNYYSHLVIENGVEIDGQKNSIVVDGTHATSVKNTLNYTTCVYQTSNEQCVANGVRVDVYGYVKAHKYALKVNGLVTKPTTADGSALKSVRTSGTWASKVPAGYTVAAGDTAYIPFIFIAAGSELKANETANESAALYCAGYADYLVQGYVHGSTGVYVKSGNIEVGEGAQIKSDNDTQTGIKSTGKGSGLDAGGNAIAIETNTKSYAGEVNLSVTGGTITAGEDGYAIQNVNAENSPEVESVVISGGTFEGGAQGCVTLDYDTTDPTVKVELEGGTFSGNIETLIAAVDNEDQIIQQVVADDGAGNATVVIGKKDANDDEVVEQPTADNNAYSLVDGDIIKLDTKNGGHIHGTLGATTVTVKYLSLTGTASDDVVITVEKDKTLSVGQIVMNAYGKIIVKAGGKLIVTGANGLFADNVENIVLEATQGNQSVFIMNPAVANNKHPKATVELISKSFYVDDNNYLNQRFGIPTIGALESITADYPTRIWGYFNAHWDLIGTVIPGTAFDASVMDQPFAYYQMSSNNPSAGTKVTMTGRLVGVEDPQIDLIANNWSTFSNSFMANIDASAMMDMFEGHPNIDATIQTFKPTNTTNFAWFPFNRANILMGENTDVEPMQAFIVKNLGAADQLQINYQSMIWEPFTTSMGASAPARRKASADITTARVEVANAQGAYDYVTLLSDAQFSAEYENGYDAEHVMNNNLDLYTVGVQNLATMATDNLDNTVLGMACAEAGEYTITFSHINGDNLTLIDRITGARIAMVEGNTYEFTAEAGEANRFEIVASAKVPTGVENTDAVKSVKGAVYTITGQYVGSVENWNVLPAGVYVVDGIKCVK